jgi:ribose-phosphate pyrophosphokinase
VNKQDTTAVLSPNSGQIDELETSHQSASALDSSAMADAGIAIPGLMGGFQSKSAPDRKRPGRLSEDKRVKIFCGSSNRALAEEI